ncbi:MAG: hypothetical protein LBF83_09080 [Spirochaetaceae bacterium]|jgi:hypothetical protein|nr:hypothetical protein [Spirochaetaceae bacterium]
MNTANMPEQFPVYSVISSDEIEILEGKLEQYLENITAVLGINNTQEILCDQLTMHEICDRVQRRRVYSHIFHGSREGNSMKMGELNEGSLLCFWILKLMPFKHNTISTTGLNVKIATTIFINTLHYVAAKSKKKGKH